MAAISRARRRILTFLIGLIGGSGVLLGPLAPDARAYERAPDVNNNRAKVFVPDSKVISQPPADSRTISVQPIDSNMKMTDRGLILRQQVFDQQQEILLKMEELKQMMQDLELKLKDVQQPTEGN